MDMKTKSVFNLLFILLLLFCFGANTKAPTEQCTCPSAISAPIAVQSSISNLLEDICADCGHTTNCCISHTDNPFTGAITLNQINPPLNLVLVAPVSVAELFVCSAVLAQSGVNKAPPRASASTLLALHQKLVI